MACVIVKPLKPSKKNYELYLRGNVENGRQIINRETFTYDVFVAQISQNDRPFIMCGDFDDLPLCTECGCAADNLCDYPVGEGKTCDRDICDDHSHEIADNLHYCAAHYAMWRQFVESDGVSKQLENVIAFKNEKLKKS